MATGLITVMAKHTVSLWIAIFSKPVVKHLATANSQRLSMFVSSPLNMVNGEEFNFLFATAGTNTSILLNYKFFKPPSIF